MNNYVPNNHDWKFCAILYTEINFDRGEQNIHFDDHLVRFFRPTEPKFNKYIIAELYTSKVKFDDFQSAFHFSVEILEKVLSRISIATYRICKIDCPISITQYKVLPNETFKMYCYVDFSADKKNKTFRSLDYPFLFETIDIQP